MIIIIIIDCQRDQGLKYYNNNSTVAKFTYEIFGGKITSVPQKPCQSKALTVPSLPCPPTPPSSLPPSSPPPSSLSSPSPPLHLDKPQQTPEHYAQELARYVILFHYDSVAMLKGATMLVAIFCVHQSSCFQLHSLISVHVDCLTTRE